MTIKLEIENFKIDKHFLKEIGLLGTPSFVSMILLSLTLGIESKIIADFGSHALSVQTITGYMFSISSSIAQGIMGVGLILMSYAAGAGQEKRYFQVLKILLAIVFAVVVIFNGVLIMNRSLLVTIFTDAKGVIELTKLPALIYGVTAPLIFSTNVFLYAMQPIGMEKLSTLIFMTQQIVLFVPLLWILKYYGFFMAISAQPISEVAGGLITLMLYPLFMQKARKYFVTFKV